jgi:opacity protein-like surface antigen
MKKNILLFLILIFTASGAEAQNFYAKISGGANFLENSSIQENNANYQTGSIISGSLGFNLRYGLTLEAEYAFRRNEIGKIRFAEQGASRHGHLQTSSLMANLIWNLPNCALWNIQPFVGAGLGYDSNHMHSSNSRISFHESWQHFSWQAIAGLSYPLLCNTRLTFDYKYHQGGHFYNHSISLGLIYKFGNCL